jgi:tripartite-type tricarboxylate transporter receptor subunit TctC
VRAGTPPEIIETLSDTLADVAASDEYKQFLEAQFAPPTFLPADKALPFLNEQLADMKAATQ